LLNNAVNEGITINQTADHVPRAAASNVAGKEANDPAWNGLVAVDDDTITAEVAASGAARAMRKEWPADGWTHGVRGDVVVEVVDSDGIGELARRAAILVTVEPVDLKTGVVPLDTVLVHLSVGRLKVLLRLAEQPRARQQETADLEAGLVAAIDRRTVDNTNVGRDIGVQHVALRLVLGGLVGRSIDGISEALEYLVHG
jgi:hypothetical protein